MKWLKAVADNPKTAAALLIGAYLFVGVTGIVGLIAPHQLNADLRFYYPSAFGALLAMLGGSLGALAIPRGVWWLERGAIAFMVGGVGCRVYSLGYQFYHDAVSLGEALISISFLSSVVCGMLVRLLYIRGLSLDPRL